MFLELITLIKMEMFVDTDKFIQLMKIISEAKIPGAGGTKIYILGPPKFYDEVKKEKGKKGESYEHNDILEKTEAFGMAILNHNNLRGSHLPFDEHFVCAGNNDPRDEYNK